MDEVSNRGSKSARGRPARSAIPDTAPIPSSDDKKSKAELLAELADLRRRLKPPSGRKPLDGALKGIEHLKAKGIEHPITLYEVLGIGGAHKLLLPESSETLIPLANEIPLHYEVLDSNQANGAMAKGGLTKISRKGAEARLEAPVPSLSNLKMRLMGSGGQEIPGTLYAKVLGPAAGNEMGVSIRFTSVPPEIASLLSGLTAGRDTEAPRGEVDPA